MTALSATRDLTMRATTPPTAKTTPRRTARTGERDGRDAGGPPRGPGGPRLAVADPALPLAAGADVPRRHRRSAPARCEALHGPALVQRDRPGRRLLDDAPVEAPDGRGHRSRHRLL